MEVSKLSDKIGGFATIPNTVIKMIPAIGSDAFTLWSYLRYRTNGESGLAFPSYATIRKDLGTEFHARRVATCIRILEKEGLMERHKRFGQSTEYTLICPVLSTVKDQSFQRVQTNKIESNKINNNNTQPPSEEWQKELQNAVFGIDGETYREITAAWTAQPDPRRHTEAMRQTLAGHQRSARTYLRAFRNFNPDWKAPIPTTFPRGQPRQPAPYRSNSALRTRTD
jgi:hypothetical protein